MKMSQIHEKSPKDCARKQAALDFCMFNKLKLLFYFTALFLLTILALMFLVWLILHPTNPHFLLQQADIIQLNATGPSSLNSSIQLTLLSHNPNKRVGIYYDQFLVHVSYKGQQITPVSTITPFYQGHGETNPLSALLVGHHQPVAPYLAYQVQHEQKTGDVVLSFEARGRLRWKVGTWISWRYRLSVNCVTNMTKVSPCKELSSKQGLACCTSV